MYEPEEPLDGEETGVGSGDGVGVGVGVGRTGGVTVGGGV